MAREHTLDRITIRKREIDTASPVPIYHQIATDIKLLFSIERWTIGSRIPSEQALSEAYGVSRVTLRQALSELEKEGFIKKINGVGSVLSASPIPVAQTLNLPGISESRDPDNPRSNFNAKVLDLQMTGPSKPINEYLGLNDRQSLIYVRRLFLRAEKPVAINMSWLNPPQMVPDLLEKRLDGEQHDKDASLLWIESTFNLKHHRAYTLHTSRDEASGDWVQCTNSHGIFPLLYRI